MTDGQVDLPQSVRPTPVHHFSGDTQAERTVFWAAEWKAAAEDMERRAREGDPVAVAKSWVDGRIVDWWRTDIEHLKRTGQLGLALDLAWRCMEAVEEATFTHNVPLNPHWAKEAAIVARKMRNYALEVQICERVLDVDFFGDLVRDEWEKRLAKAEQLVAKAQP